MMVCMNCRQILRCVKNGVAIDYGYGHTYPGDAWTCPKCGFSIINTMDHPVHDEKYAYSERYLKMDIENKKPDIENFNKKYLEFLDNSA